MKSHYRSRRSRLGWLILVLLATAVLTSPRLTPAQDAAAPQAERRGSGEGRMPLFGKITAIHDSSIEVEDVNGGTTTVKLSDKTEFRKDRQPAKRADFKVGDVIMVRGDENPDHTWTAQIVGARSMNGPNARGAGGPGRGGRGDFGQAGTLGKDFVAGEIKSVDAPKISVLRTDNVTQTIELKEDTSVRKGRDAITMADIQVGDHLFARGGLENNVFVPKMVMVIGPEQWKRMQEMGGGPAGGPRRPPSAAPGAGSDAQKPAEPQR